MDSIQSPSKSTLGFDQYITPQCVRQFPYNPTCLPPTTFPTQKRKRKTIMASNLQMFLNTQHRPIAPKKYPKANLYLLADWIRFTAVGLRVEKHVFDNALAIMKDASWQLDATYSLAAGSLLLAVKLAYGPLLMRQKELPIKPAKHLPRVLLTDAADSESHILKALDFMMPMPSHKLHLLLELTQSWNNHLESYFQQGQQFPFYLYRMGFRGRFQQRNITCAGYLMDLLCLGSNNCETSDEIYLTAAMIVVCAVNTSQQKCLTSPNFRLNIFGKCFLQRECQISQEQVNTLNGVLQGVARHKLYERLSKIPHKGDVNIGQNMEQRLRWLNKLELVPFSDEGEMLWQ